MKLVGTDPLVPKTQKQIILNRPTLFENPKLKFISDPRSVSFNFILSIKMDAE